ncbi:MAG: DUF1353 domain-containing protein [Salinisphaeraceae bacterium]
MFTSSLKAESIPDGRWALTHPLTWDGPGGMVITVPRGFPTDLFSIPRPFWWLFKPDHPGRRAAVVHDYIYRHQTHRYTRATADRIFRQALAWCGVSWLTRWTMWAGVRIGGRGNW